MPKKIYIHVYVYFLALGKATLTHLHQMDSWSDTAFWSGSALFANCPFGDLQTKMG